MNTNIARAALHMRLLLPLRPAREVMWLAVISKSKKIL